jgi:hypothetical protein
MLDFVLIANIVNLKLFMVPNWSKLFILFLLSINALLHNNKVYFKNTPWPSTLPQLLSKKLKIY